MHFVSFFFVILLFLRFILCGVELLWVDYVFIGNS